MARSHPPYLLHLDHKTSLGLHQLWRQDGEKDNWAVWVFSAAVRSLMEYLPRQPGSDKIISGELLIILQAQLMFVGHSPDPNVPAPPASSGSVVTPHVPSD